MKMTSSSKTQALLFYRSRKPIFSSSPFSAIRLAFSAHHHHHHHHLSTQSPTLQTPKPFSLSSIRVHNWVGFPSIPSSPFSLATTLRYLSTTCTEGIGQNEEHPLHYESSDEVEPIESWEEEDEVEPEIGDGGDGGGVVLQNCPWGEHALAIAQEVLLVFGNDMELFAFKTSPRGYIYVRLDKLPNKYGCPSMEEMESYSHQYKKRLDEVGASGEIPEDLALEVSSPGAERLLRVPDDLHRFKDMPMRVSYKQEDIEGRSQEKNGVFFLDSIDTESESCTWRLADVKENRDPSVKGRPLSRKQKDWRLNLPYAMFKRVTLYLDY